MAGTSENYPFEAYSFQCEASRLKALSLRLSRAYDISSQLYAATGLPCFKKQYLYYIKKEIAVLRKLGRTHQRFQAAVVLNQMGAAYEFKNGKFYIVS